MRRPISRVGMAALSVGAGYALLWCCAQWSTHRIKAGLPAIQAKERSQNERVLRELLKNDGSARDRIVKALLHQGFPRPDGTSPLIDATDFFDTNEDDYTIAANLRPHPPIRQFREVLLGLRRDPRVKAVKIEVVDFEEWPYSDTVHVVADLPRQELLQKVDALRPTEVSTAVGEQIHPGLYPLASNTPVYILWWD